MRSIIQMLTRVGMNVRFSGSHLPLSPLMHNKVVVLVCGINFSMMLELILAFSNDEVICGHYTYILTCYSVLLLRPWTNTGYILKRIKH